MPKSDYVTRTTPLSGCLKFDLEADELSLHDRKPAAKLETRSDTSYLSKPRAPRETCELGLNNPDSEKTLEDLASKAQKVLARVKRVIPGLTVRDFAFFSSKKKL